ncbi:MAG: tRNA pseudouridine(55) synthase TruB [Actinomycetaceae bacterium]|nr:tRNA pseudouridine(55) synthase TruB [Actinomycetaceae bacterium]
MRIEVPRAVIPARSGIVVVDKPVGVTSHDVVSAFRRLAGTRKVGHAGTLDPAASGVLVLGIGGGTRLLSYLTGADKDYQATVRLGVETHSEDATGEITRVCGGGGVTLEAVDGALDKLSGEVMQVPSAVSAKKVAGRRAHELVRQGADFELAPVPVTISRLKRTSQMRMGEFWGTEVADFDMEVTCSSGTYVRAIARDLGAALGCGAHLRALRRTRVGTFTQMATIEGLATAVAAGEALPTISLAQAAAAFPKVSLSEQQVADVRNGKRLYLPLRGEPGYYRALDVSQNLVAMAHLTMQGEGMRLQPSTVFQNE